MVTVSSNESYTVTWDFGDGNRSVGPTCDHTYSKPGDYNVTTWIVDSQGGNTTKLQVVSVSEAASTTDNTMLYAIVAVIAIAVVAVIAVVFVRGRKK